MNPRTQVKTGKTSFSIELFPPKDEPGESRLWEAVDQLSHLTPDFVSVTYGAGGSTRDRTIRIASQLTTRTGISTVAHLTCVGSTRAELENILNQYKAANIQTILVLRGDPVGGPGATWVTTPGGFDHAEELVELAAMRGDFTIGVGAFPDGHPASRGDFAKDIEVLVRKEAKGATFATTQFFFDVGAYKKLVEALDAAGSNLSIIAGVMPVTNVKQLSRMAELGGTPIPREIAERFAAVADNESAVVELGIEIATQLCNELIAAGAPGIHFITMNKASATEAIVKNIGLR
ncbi:MAG TPA: methylenetetrahydrofolate reductase [NAD(P)H] [Candidatus Nanopelagicaceae bacterium]